MKTSARSLVCMQTMQTTQTTFLQWLLTRAQHGQSHLFLEPTLHFLQPEQQSEFSPLATTIQQSWYATFATHTHVSMLFQNFLNRTIQPRLHTENTIKVSYVPIQTALQRLELSQKKEHWEILKQKLYKIYQNMTQQEQNRFETILHTTKTELETLPILNMSQFEMFLNEHRQHIQQYVTVVASESIINKVYDTSKQKEIVQQWLQQNEHTELFVQALQSNTNTKHLFSQWFAQTTSLQEWVQNLNETEWIHVQNVLQQISPQLQTVSFSKQKEIVQQWLQQNEHTELFVQALQSNTNTKHLFSQWFAQTTSLQAWVQNLNETEWIHVQNVLQQISPQLQAVSSSKQKEIVQQWLQQNEHTELFVQALQSNTNTKHLFSQWFAQTASLQAWVQNLNETEWIHVQNVLQQISPQLQAVSFSKQKEIVQQWLQQNEHTELFVQALQSNTNTKHLFSQWFAQTTSLQAWVQNLNETEWSHVQNILEQISPQLQTVSFSKQKEIVQQWLQQHEHTETLIQVLLSHKHTKPLFQKWIQHIQTEQLQSLISVLTEQEFEQIKPIFELFLPRLKTIALEAEREAVVQFLGTYQEIDLVLQRLEEQQEIQNLIKNWFDDEVTFDRIQQQHHLQTFVSMLTKSEFQQTKKVFQEFLPRLHTISFETEKTAVQQWLTDFEQSELLLQELNKHEQTKQFVQKNSIKVNELQTFISLLTESEWQQTKSVLQQFIPELQSQYLELQKTTVQQWLNDTQNQALFLQKISEHTQTKDLLKQFYHTDVNTNALQTFISLLTELEWQQTKTVLQQFIPELQTQYLELEKITVQQWLNDTQNQALFLQKINEHTQTKDLLKRHTDIKANELQTFVSLLTESEWQQTKSVLQQFIPELQSQYLELQKTTVQQWLNDTQHQTLFLQKISEHTQTKNLLKRHTDIKVNELQTFISLLTESEWQQTKSVLQQFIPELQSQYLELQKRQIQTLQSVVAETPKHTKNTINTIHTKNIISHVLPQVYQNIQQHSSILQSEHLVYDTSDLVLTQPKQKQTLTQPPINTTQISELVSQQVHKQMQQFQNMHTQKEYHSLQKLQELTQQLQKQSQELETIRESQKQFLHTKYISIVTERVLQKMQSQLKLEKMRRGL